MPSQTWDELLKIADTDGGGFEPLPPGDYDFVISKAEHGLTNEHKKSKYDIQAKVIHGTGANRIVFHNFTISPENPKALGFFFRNFAVLGLTRAEFWSKKPTEEEVCAALVGKVFRGSVLIEAPWKDGAKERNKITKFFTASDAAVLAAKSVTLGGNSSSTPSVPSQGVPSQGPAQGVPTPSAAPAPGVPSAPVAPPVAAPPAPPVVTNSEVPLPPAPPPSF